MSFCYQSFLGREGRVRLELWRGNFFLFFFIFFFFGLYTIVRVFLEGILLGAFVTRTARFVGFLRDFIDNIFVVS